MKTKRIFLRDIDSGEPSSYCGSTKEEVLKAISCYLETYVDAFLSGSDEFGDCVTLDLESREMSDDEVRALPNI
jgi:hypothetical protein